MSEIGQTSEKTTAMVKGKMATCCVCQKDLARSSFSKNQWRNKDPPNRKCKSCTGAAAANNNNTDSGRLQETATAATLTPVTMTKLSLEARPQKEVPGFDDLTVCADWPKTKTGHPPGAQSAIFTPLLACVIGPIQGHCTDEQLEVAKQWWTAALPAWPRWVAALQEAGVGDTAYREKLLSSVRGRPNPLVFKAKGRGT